MHTLSPIDFIKCADGIIFLNSNLDEMMFAKTKFSLLLDETGIIAKTDNNKIWNQFSEWKFSESRTIEEKVYFCGNFNGIPLSKMIETENPQTEKALYSVCEVYANAINQNIKIPCNGAAGIIVNQENDEILFLPEKTFDRSAANFGKAFYNYIQNNWRDYIAQGAVAESFSLGTFAYYSIAKTLPYSEENDKKISDRNFLPLECAVNGINKKLATSVNALLSGKPLKSDFPLNKLKS